jgi:hypothetical protein
MLQFGNKPCLPIAIQTFIRHTWYMNEIQKMFTEAIDTTVIGRLTNEQLDELSKILEKI